MSKIALCVLALVLSACGISSEARKLAQVTGGHVTTLKADVDRIAVTNQRVVAFRAGAVGALTEGTASARAELETDIVSRQIAGDSAAKLLIAVRKLADQIERQEREAEGLAARRTAEIIGAQEEIKVSDQRFTELLKALAEIEAKTPLSEHLETSIVVGMAVAEASQNARSNAEDSAAAIDGGNTR